MGAAHKHPLCAATTTAPSGSRPYRPRLSRQQPFPNDSRPCPPHKPRHAETTRRWHRWLFRKTSDIKPTLSPATSVLCGPTPQTDHARRPPPCLAANLPRGSPLSAKPHGEHGGPVPPHRWSQDPPNHTDQQEPPITQPIATLSRRLCALCRRSSNSASLLEEAHFLKEAALTS
jgi:hypothetical protein